MSHSKYVADLDRSGIPVDTAEEAGMYYEANAQDVLPEFKPMPVLVIPYADPETGELLTFDTGSGRRLPFARVRYLVGSGPGGRKYDQPRFSGVMPYFSPLMDWRAVLDNPAQEITITEGEKKATALCLAGVPAIGLGGVYNFTDRGEFLAHLERINWNGRNVVIMFDSDRATNPNIRVAEDRLAAELSTIRKANVAIVNLPGGEDGEKIGADDFLVRHGKQALYKLMDNAMPLKRIDLEVRRMNEDVAYIRADDCLFDIKKRVVVRKAGFLKGDALSTRSFTQASQNANKMVRVQVSSEWLTHPDHRVYDDVKMDPSTTEETLEINGLTYLNLWTGLPATEGPTEPFWELTKFLGQRLPPDQQELLWKLMAYKAQNPAEKVPLAIVLVGGQGGGKSMWAEIMRLAFEPYSGLIQSASLGSQFNGWIERALVTICDEAKGAELTGAKENLKTYISEKRVLMNEKFRTARMVDNFTTLILTSNERSVASFEYDDRRMFVVECPPNPKTAESAALYSRVAEWIKNDGPKHLMGEFLKMDLQGWRPPSHAPMTAEKYVAMIEGLSPVGQLAREMREADTNAILRWCDTALAWAAEADMSNNPGEKTRANEVLKAISNMPIRPFYTAQELVLLFPAAAADFHKLKTAAAMQSALSRELRDNGIELIKNKDDYRGFLYRGKYHQYLQIAEMADWPSEITQEEFNRVMPNFPTYGEVRGLHKGLRK